MIAEVGPENCAVFVAEPILASGGVIVPPEGYHQRCLEVCRKNDMLYLSDEVVTAFGRLGHHASLVGAAGDTLLNTLSAQKIFIPSACGGGGSCG